MILVILLFVIIELIIIKTMSESTSEKSSKSGRPKKDIWKHFQEADKLNGHYSARCIYCNWKRQRGKPAEMIDHLINVCPNVPSHVKLSFHQQQQCNETTTKKRTHDGLQTHINEHFQNSSIEEQRTKLINKSLIKFFTCCGISFSIVEHPFFVDFVKT